MLLYAVGHKYLVDATAEVAGGGEKVWHSINHSILSGLMLLYAVGQKYLVDATAEVAGCEKVWHSINHSILSGLMLLYAVGQKYLVDATAEVAGGPESLALYKSFNTLWSHASTYMLSVRNTWWMPPLRWRGARKSGTL